MKRIYIWGSSDSIIPVLESLNYQKCDIIGLIDNDEKRVGTFVDGLEVVRPNHIDKNVDYIIIAAKVFYPEIKAQICRMGYEESKILCFYDIKDCNFNTSIDFVNYSYRIYTILFMNNESEFLKNRNFEYEMADKIRKNEYQFPIVKSAIQCLKKIKEQRISLCRFGDGEFEMIFERKRPAFQEPNSELALRLKEVLVNDRDDIITCIENFYGSLDEYNDSAAKGMRSYLSPSVRQEHMKVIDLHKEYYDTHVSRPYIIYKDKTNAQKVFDLWKSVWNERDIVLIEGEYSRCGIGNDLFSNAKSVERILCPAENAWDFYNEILEFVCDVVEKDKLILIALGPTATVLAYDLGVDGYQAIDMGHLDNEYEWFLGGVEKRTNIRFKYVNECGVIGRQVEEINDKEYTSQIIAKIGVRKESSLNKVR